MYKKHYFKQQMLSILFYSFILYVTLLDILKYFVF